MNEALLQDSTRSCWLYFTHPHQIIQTNLHSEIIPALQEINQLVAVNHYYAVGFLTYDAAPGFDPAAPVQLKHNPDFLLPLLYFALYAPPKILSHPDFPNLHNDIAVPVVQWSPEITRPIYDQAINTIRHHIKHGDTYQVNYTWRLHGQFSADPRPWFQQMVAAQNPCHAAYLDIGAWTILSISPELFFSLAGTQLITRPMKGTAARAPDYITDRRQAENLFIAPKDRAENIMIVDMMRNDLGRIAQLGSVQVMRLFDIEQYPTVWQMTSTIQAQTTAPLADIFRALFPAASITGAPKIKTLEIIAGLESDPRGIYTGAIGFIAPERRAEFNVAIRTVVLNRQTGNSQYGVGGGIVWDSQPESEYEECLTKTRVLQTYRPNFELVETLLWTPQNGFWLLAEHLERIILSARYFGYPTDSELLLRSLNEITRNFSAYPHRVRLLLAANGAIRHEFTLYQEPSGVISLALALNPLDSSDPFLYHKTTHRLQYDQARRETPQAMDVILWNERREITETTIANLVIELDGDFFTPPISAGLLAGTYRQKLLSEGLIHESTITLTDIKRARCLWIINSVRGWQAAQILESSS